MYPVAYNGYKAKVMGLWPLVRRRYSVHVHYREHMHSCWPDNDIHNMSNAYISLLPTSQADGSPVLTRMLSLLTDASFPATPRPCPPVKGSGSWRQACLSERRRPRRVDSKHVLSYGHFPPPPISEHVSIFTAMRFVWMIAGVSLLKGHWGIINRVGTCLWDWAWMHVRLCV